MSRRDVRGFTLLELIIALAISLGAALGGTNFAIPEFASTLFFNLFMFAVGMKVGPQFLSGLRRDAKSFVLLGLLIPVLAVGLIFVVRAIFDPAPGILPGIFAGSNTATPGLGSAQAAYTSGASWWDAFRRVLLPLLSPAFWAGWIFVFLLSAKELSMSVLLAGPQSQVVSVMMFDLWNNGQVVEVAAFGVIWTAVLSVTAVAFFILARRYGLRIA